MANYTSTHTGATIDASVTIISSSGVTQSDLVKLNAVTSSAVELNLLDGVTASTAELNILDGATLSVTELNYLDGADSSITTLSLPDNTTITTFGASLVDDADAASARTTLGVDVAGTDNSTNVTLVTTSHDYLSLSGQAITLGQIDISDDTNLVGGDGLALTGDTLSVNVDDSSIEINSDTLRVKASGVTNAMLAGSIVNAKLSNSSLSYGGVSVALGASDATPAFDLSDATSLPIVAGTTGTLSVARGGTGSTTASGARTNLNVDVAGTDNSTDVTLVTTSYDYLSLSGQAITLGQIDIGDDTNLVGGTGITLTGDTLSTTDSEIVHDNLSGFVANEHIDHSGVSITAGAGLTGGGDITSTRDIAVGAGTGVTVNANDVAIGQDVATSADVEFNSVTADIIGDIRGATKFQAKADVALNKGDAVYISGVSGTTPTVDIADANDSAKMPSFGLAASSVSINASVEIITFGTLAGLNTSAFSVGDIIYISTNGTSGNTLTATVPTGESSLIQNIGIVQRSHASAGSIKVGGAGRTNATPNLDDGDIFIGNGSNQAVTAALNTKIQDYLNTGVNLPSPTFSGDIDFDDASTPVLKITDTTNTVSTIIKSDDSFGNIGTVSNHHLKIKRNDVDIMTFFAGYAAINNDGNDYDFRILDSGGANLFSTDAANSRVGILDSTPSYTLDVNGTGRFTGAVQLDDNLTVTGDLQVNGTTTTVNQTNLDVSDNIIGLNRGASSNANDSGIIIERGSTGDNVFIGWKESSDRIRFATTTADASATGNLTLTNANVQAGRFYGDVTGNVTGDVTGDVTGNADTATALATGRTISLTGDVTGTSASFDGSGNVALATTIAANSVALGTDTTGNYMSDLTEGTGIDISHTPGEGSNGTITLDLTEVGFGGGANRLITDDGDGTVSTEANLTFDGTNLAIAGAGKLYFGGGSHTYISEDIDDRLRFFVGGAEMFRLNEINDFASFFTDVAMASGDKLYFDGGGNTYITESSADVLKIFVGNEAKLEIDEGNENIFLNTNNLTFRTPGFTAQSKFDILNNKLGIGTTSPASPLEVNGNVAFGDTATGIKGTIHSTDEYRINALDVDENGYNSLHLRADGTDGLFIQKDTNNVGIGTTSPGSALEVNGIIESNTSDGLGYFRLDVSGTNKAIVGLEPAVGGGSANDLSIYSRTGNLRFWANGGQKAIIDTSGNVGIGTTSPGALLDVVGTGYIRTAVFSDAFKPYSGTLATYGNNSSTDHYFVGDVGIGTASPEVDLHIVDDTYSQLRVETSGAGNVEIETQANDNSDEAFFGTRSNHDLKFRTNWTNAMTIDTSQNVGIGETSPAHKLDVNGGIRNYANGSAVFRTESTAAGYGAYNKLITTTNTYDLYALNGDFKIDENGVATRFVIKDSTGHIQLPNDLQYLTFGAGGDGVLYSYEDNFYVSNHTAGKDTIFTNLNSDSSSYVEIMRLDGSTSRVGIGTESPSTITEIKSTIPVLTLTDDQNKSWTSSDTTLGKLSFKTSDTSGIGVHEIGFISLDCNLSSSTTPNGELVFGTAGVNATATEKMRIDESGNVGIGTTSPGRQVHLSGEGVIRLDSTSADPGLDFNTAGTSDMQIRYRAASDLLQIYSYGTSSNIVTIKKSDGNVGIGTDAPAEKLDVDGRVQIRNSSFLPSPPTNAATLHTVSGEMYVEDSGGNTTQISPHNFSLIPGGASEKRAWSYYSQKYIKDDEGNVTATQKVNVDMMKLARLVEQLTGEKLVYTEED